MLQLISLSLWHIMNGNCPFRKLISMVINLAVIIFWSDYLITKVVYSTIQQSWLGKWIWLHYDSTKSLCFCHTCVSGLKTGKMKLSSSTKDLAFLSEGFSNWKDATVGFDNLLSEVIVTVRLLKNPNDAYFDLFWQFVTKI